MISMLQANTALKTNKQDDSEEFYVLQICNLNMYRDANTS